MVARVTRRWQVTFNVLAAAVLLPAPWHLGAGFGNVDPGVSSTARHLVFFLIDVPVVGYLLYRSAWGFPLFCVLAVQQTLSHGGSIVRYWQVGTSIPCR